MAKCENAILLFHDWERAFEILTDSECKKILMAMFAYSKRGTEPPEFEGMGEAVACFVFPAMQRHNDRVKIGRAGGLKRAENAAAKKEDAGQSTTESDTYTVSTPHEDNLNTTLSQLEDNSDDVSTTRQDKDKTKQDKNKTRQDEDKTKQTAADVSSVISLAIEVCNWLEVPTGVSTKTHQLIQNYGYTNDDYRKLFEMANESNFLRGGGDRGWIATFDWLIEHMDEVTGGKYRTWEKQGATAQQDYYDTSRYENMTW